MNSNYKIDVEMAEQTLAVLHECLEEGIPISSLCGAYGGTSAKVEAARRLGITPQTMGHRLRSIEQKLGLKPDLTRYVPKKAVFEVEPLPHDGEPDAEELINRLKASYAARKAHHDASKLRQVKVNIDGPIAVAFVGDPHVDDPGCAWGDLERDVRICRETEGVLAVDVGDNSNNWVGRLMALYANQEVTAKQSLKLVEWLMLQLNWLLDVDGNHDVWHTDTSDPREIMHRLHKRLGVKATSGARLHLTMPAGNFATMHVRHDFPGGSQFNPAHALVRETLFGFRDHMMACGHRHSAVYIPVWHNDPKRLCHGFRVGTYKDMDHYSRDKGFQENNWARSMAAVIDPDYADDPVRYIKPFFSLEDAAEYLTWRRSKWEVGKTAS